MKMYMKDSDGKKSFTVTISLITFAVVMLKVLLGGVEFSAGDMSISFGSIGSDEIAALLAPTLGAYVARRYTDTRYRGIDPNEAEPPLPGEEGAV